MNDVLCDERSGWNLCGRHEARGRKGGGGSFIAINILIVMVIDFLRILLD